MRERSARVESRARSQRAQRGRGRGGARTMPRWLWAAVLLAAAGTGVAAWTPPEEPILLTPRSRRHVLSNTRHLQLLGWHLELQENRAIRSPYYDECLFYKGRVIGEENSTATVTECAGQLYGLLQVGKEDFVLQPTRADGAHVLRRRDVLFTERPAAYNLTGDTVTDLELDLEEDAMLTPTPLVRSRHAESTETEYFRAEPIYRPISGVNGLWLEMAIVADHTMLKFHGRERVNHYILALMNIVSAIFNDPSLDSNMTLVINNLYILNEDKDSIVKFGNVKKSLEAVNKWNYKHLIKLPAGNNGWDATVWLTRAPLGGPSGFAPVGGVCSRQRSAAINRDEGLTSAFVIAHELAHLLGLTHDGENSCQTEGSRGSVMAPTVLATLHNYAWSSCSKKQFHEKSKLWWCLHERSREDGVELGGAKALSNYVFTLDEQCRTEFGEGFSVCTNPMMVRSAVCSRLWCANSSDPDVCRSKRAPPLEGTPCGKNKWCVDRVCEPMPGPGTNSRVDVGSTDDKRARWGEWGEWSGCTANCGYGLRSRMRRCRHRGLISPSACEGASSQDAVCWAGRACTATRDARALLCYRQKRTLIPHVPTDESKQCEIWCMGYTGGAPSNFGSLPDGTPCSYDKPYDVCSQGTCVKGQCNSTDPTCNWCPDGYCVNNTRIYQKQLAKEWTQVMIPFGSHQLSIHITTPVPLHIALRELKRGKPVIELSKHSKQIEIHDQQGNYLKYDPNVPQNLQIIEVDSNVIDIKESRYRWEGEVVAAGTVLRWRQTDTDVVISSAAPLQTDLIIMVIPESALPTEELVTVQVAVNYSMAVATERARPLENRRTRIRWPCSASCGGGVRVVRPRCNSRDATKCPPTRYQPCNTHSCEFAWANGEWEECSATCGSAGIRERQIYCVPANVSTSTRAQLIRYSVSPALCPALKPDRQQDCNRLPCPVYWREEPWTPCSTTYGRCMSRRPVECPASDESLCGPKPRERRRFCRRRRCSGGLLPSRLTIVCPPSDTTQYCEFFNVEELRRNCQVQPFRKHCCNACKDVDRFRHSSRFS